MTAQEMLDELRELIADEIPTYNFSVTRALGYLNEGQQKFCEDTGFFSDTTEFTIDTEAGAASYALDPRIIRINRVLIDGRVLPKLKGYRAPATAETPSCWESNSNSGALSVWPTPSTVVTMELHVWRYPLRSMALGGDYGVDVVEPEIPMRMHRACIEHAAYKCYCHHDIELKNDKDAIKHKAAYRQYVLEGRALKNNMDANEIEIGTNSCYQV